MTSNTTHRLLVVLVALLAVGALLPVGVSAQDGDRQARLALEQPAYIDSDPAESTANDSRLYTVQGEAIDIRPQNFNQSAVVDFGVSTTGAELEYDAEMRNYEFRPSAEGTYTVFWIVSERVNGSIEQHRYVARLRVSGGLNQTHLPQSAVSESQSDAQKWREFNATVTDLSERNLLLQSADLTNSEVIQGMVNAYILVNDPLAALTGNLTGTVLLLTTTLGGGLVLALLLAGFTVSIGLLYKRLNRFEVLEPTEGAIAERFEAAERLENDQSLQDTDTTTIVDDPHLAAATRDQGETPKEQWTKLTEKAIRPRLWVRDRLEAMGANGWVAKVTKRSAADGGAGEDAVPLAAEVVRADAVAEDADTEPLSQVDNALLEAIDWDQDAIVQFDLADADLDPDRFSGGAAVTLSVPELVAELDVDSRQFEDQGVLGQYLLELVESVREHPFTDHDGEPNSTRLFLEELLRSAELLDDRYGFPIAQYQVDAIRRALSEYDAADIAEQYMDDVRSGRNRGEQGAD